jgi:hypothetical protein
MGLWNKMLSFTRPIVVVVAPIGMIKKYYVGVKYFFMTFSHHSWHVLRAKRMKRENDSKRVFEFRDKHE